MSQNDPPTPKIVRRSPVNGAPVNGAVPGQQGSKSKAPALSSDARAVPARTDSIDQAPAIRVTRKVFGITWTATSGWERGVQTALRRFQFVAGATFAWLVAAVFQLLPLPMIDASRLILSVVLFVLAIPTAIILRLDDFSKNWGADGYHNLVILVALLMVLLNFVAIGAVVGWLRGDTPGPKKEKKKRGRPT
ncbi:MAG: hypothetical protein KDD69_13970 [Bdellovibrionales bacterium]|nr:hypothetical protein [Bdellovibrionales bacterium]